MSVRVGTSFSPRRCAAFGLSPKSTFRDVLGMRFGLVRVSAYWDQIAHDGFAELDWILDEAQRAGQRILLTVGMKGIQWPEFYLPAGSEPSADPHGRIGPDGRFAEAVITFVSETVSRYRDHPEIAAWQVENEPLNRSGPRRWWIDPRLVRREMAAVRALDARPIVINAFAHFESSLDSESRPRVGLFNLLRLVPEKAILGLLGGSDILGLDVYTAIGAHDEGTKIVRRAAADWSESAGHWLRAAQAQGKDAWIIESQAEPWEPSHETWADPLSFAPEDMATVFGQLTRAGYSTILLWGCEYWCWRAAQGDARWLESATRIIGLQ